jgi:hypothetical protein
MRVLHVHNFYQLPGGEDLSFAATGAMLEDRGHEVIRYTLHNDAIDGMGRLETARKTIWNGAVHQDLQRLLRDRNPDVAHFENIFPLVSPAAYYACHAEGVPVVQTLRNFRMVCPSGILHRDGAICEDCLHKTFPWPGVRRGGDRSRSARAGVAANTTAQRHAGTWRKKIEANVARNGLVRAKFKEAGFDAVRIQ